MCYLGLCFSAYRGNGDKAYMYMLKFTAYRRQSEIDKIFKEVGLTSVIRFETDIATMEIVNHEKPEDRIYITSPMSEASLKGCHPVQNLGAVETYVRRYLWVTALEIVEHDGLDSSAPIKVEENSEIKEEKKGISVSNDHQLLVDSMISWGDSCKSLSELQSLWKVNQPAIDGLKNNDKEKFKLLQDHFATLKTKLKEE